MPKEVKMRTAKKLSGRTIKYNEYRFVDINGIPVQRDPISFPYSFDPYVLYKSKDFNPTDLSAYSDRVERFSFTVKETDKEGEIYEREIDFAELISQYGSTNRFYWTNPEQVSLVMSLVMGKQVQCTAILEGCNVATGYPFWLVYVK